ncbi:MAG: dTMP kinase [Bacillota bacterium]|nr:dTMP kinase [Bacillota bacterium]HWR55034.1 dTMP kinase [Negativicutes bacterium]
MGGLFITFEGPDGAGKTTQLRILAERFAQEGYDVLCTREPGGTRISDKIREMLLDSANREMHARAEALLYAAARAQHVAEVIDPALQSGKVVLCDRFVDSSLAYQGWGRGLPLEMLYVINNFATDKLRPDLTLLLDISPQEGTARVDKRCGGRRDRIEDEQDGFRQRVRQGFRELAGLHASRMVPIDAGRPVEAVHAEIWAHVEQIIVKKEGSA